jgi:hypothetical protein
MPFIYSVTPGAEQTSNGTGGTENDSFFIKAGSTRNVALQSLIGQGKANALTAISGLMVRIKKWTSTAASGGTGITPTPRDPGMQAAKGTAGYATSAVTTGTGGPSVMGAFGMGASGPGGWVAANADSPMVLEGAATQSIDAFVSSGTATMKYELSAETIE